MRATDVLVVAMLVVVPTALHYVTPHEYAYLHGIFRRLYYLPIIYAAFRMGLIGSLVTTTVVALVYIPHAFLARFHDPGTTTEKVLEIVIYFVVAAVTGMLVSRLRAEIRRQKAISLELRASIEEKKKAEAQLMLADRLAALGQLGAGLAHEIRNPLGTIKGAAQILGEYRGVDDPRSEVVDLLVRETDHLDAVLERFRGFVRPSSPQKGRVDMVHLVRETVGMLGARAGEDRLNIDVDGPDEPLLVHGDGTLLRQVLVNLGLNALQHMSPGGTLGIVLGREQGSVVVHFEDEGPGVDESSVGELFNPFYTTRADGMGLGLAVSYRIVEDHGGEIRVANRSGVGSVFTVVLPACEESADDR